MQIGKRNGSDKKATVPGVDEDSDAVKLSGGFSDEKLDK